MPDLFKEIVPSILRTKKSVIHDDIDAKDYKPYVVNKALSYYKECVFYANQINQYSDLDSDMQYQYLLNTIRPKITEFKKWQKSVVDADLNCVKEYFGFSNEKAKQALHILSKDQLAEIKAKTNKGGV